MALFARLSTPSSPKGLRHIQNCIGFLWPSLQKSTQIDVIDCFTTDLVAKKTEKWETLKHNIEKSSQSTKSLPSKFGQGIEVVAKGVINDMESIRTPELGLDIRTLSQAQLDNLLSSTVEIKNKIDFLYLTNQCIQWRQLPSENVLVECLKYLSTLGKAAHIEKINEVCKLERNPIVKTYVDLAPFKGMSLWRNGSSDIALATLAKGYSQNCKEVGKRMIRSAFKTISEETLASKSSAVLVSLLKTAEKIYEEQKDVFVLACVWKNCFSSDWFSDQKSAEKLFDDYGDLRSLICRRSSTLCSSFLRQHNIDAVHRLVELFLREKSMEPCQNCLRLLFDYHSYRRNLRACAEIVKSSNELELSLTEQQNEQFLNMFLNQPIQPFTKQPRANRYQYKF